MVDLNPSTIGASLGLRRKGRPRIRIGIMPAMTGVGVLALIYLGLMFTLFHNTNDTSSSAKTTTDLSDQVPPRNLAKPNLVVGDTTGSDPQKASPPKVSISQSRKRQQYSDWKALAVELAALLPEEILSILKSQDPFGVRTFEERLLQTESDRQAILSLDDIKAIFPCPTQERITLPDQRDHVRAKKFRDGLSQMKQHPDDFVFLFFQHLRKAGGTNFCTLAEKNLLRPQVPPYFCMPDMYWNDKRCGGCFLSYTNEDIASRMQQAGHRILGNEWDHFTDRFFDLPAVFATSFRRPLDRAISQFRFECIEDRGCKIKKIEPWWQRRRDLTNVYTWTFSGRPIRAISVGKTEEDAKKRQEVMAKAMDTVAKYNLVMVMEWLAYAPDHVRDVLGFQDTSTMTERIRPHINQAKRNDGQEHNQLGAAGIAKASWTPENYLSPEQYKIMSEDLALDEILTDAARRMFLERLVCDDMSEDQFLR